MFLIDRPGKAMIAPLEPALVGSTVIMYCKTSDQAGSSPVSYKWKRPGSKDYDEVFRDTLTLLDVQLTSAGDYMCLPVNEVGEGEAATAKLVVHGRPLLMYGYCTA